MLNPQNHQVDTTSNHALGAPRSSIRVTAAPPKSRANAALTLLCLLSLFILLNNAAFAQSSTDSTDSAEPIDAKKSKQESTSAVDSVFGKAEVTESRRESGQRYLIELEHSGGAKQYIEENDSDGRIESTENDIEDTPNLPKWKLGSW